MTEASPNKNFQITNNNAVDQHVGSRVRFRRTLLGMSQDQLGTALDITFQQVQKYERGVNRISASRLWDISQILDVPISYFFNDMPDAVMSASPRRMSLGDQDGDGSHQKGNKTIMRDPMARRETLELVRIYYSVESAKTRKRISEMVKAVAITVNGS